jgi:hypothetical protein
VQPEPGSWLRTSTARRNDREMGVAPDKASISTCPGLAKRQDQWLHSHRERPRYRGCRCPTGIPIRFEQTNQWTAIPLYAGVEHLTSLLDTPTRYRSSIVARCKTQHWQPASSILSREVIDDRTA